MIRQQLAAVEASQAEVKGLLNTFHAGIADHSKHEVEQAEKAKKLAMGRNYASSRLLRLRKMQQVLETSKRIEIDRCLSMIRGGADKVYFELMTLLANEPAERRCAIMKEFQFPDLKKEGFSESFALRYRVGPAPANDGSEVLFFAAAKTALMKCMCEQKAVPLQKPFKVRLVG